MRRIKLALAGMLLFSAAAMAMEQKPSVGIRSVFFRGEGYPGDPHTLELVLLSDNKSKSHTVEMSPFSRKVLEDDFIMPVGDMMNVGIRENKLVLVNIGVTTQGKGVDLWHSCARLPDLSHSYPREVFPTTHIPPGLLTLACRTPIGIIEMQLTCSLGPSCWQVGESH